MEGRLASTWRDIQGQNILEKESLRTALSWSARVVVGMLEMVQSQWKYCCDIVHKRVKVGLRIKHHEWFKGRVQVHLKKGMEKMEEEDHHLVHRTFRELWDKGGSNKIIWFCAVKIARGEGMDDRERLSGQIWKQQR